MFRDIKFTILLSLLLIFLLGCGSVTTQNNSISPENNNPNSYPSSSENFYPAPGMQTDDLVGYPPAQFKDESKRFEFYRPLSPGMEIVSGTGPANIPIQITSVSNIGEILGVGTIKEDNTFEIQLTRALDSNEAIAIMLADDSMQTQFLDAPNATDIPLVGFILDMASTAQP